MRSLLNRLINLHLANLNLTYRFANLLQYSIFLVAHKVFMYIIDTQVIDNKAEKISSEFTQIKYSKWGEDQNIHILFEP
jgi:hypothetical protein